MTLYNADQMAEADASTGNRLVTDTMAKRFHFLDRIGHNTTMTSGIGELLGTTASYSYNSSGQRTEEQVSSVAGKGPSLSYSFDAAGGLSSYAGPYGGSPVSVAASFPPGMGESVSGHPGNAISQSYLYNGAGLLSSIVSATTKRQPSHRAPSLSASTTELTWDTAGTTPVVIEKNNAYFIYGPQDLPIEGIYSPTTNSASRSSTVLYYLQDGLGSTRALSGSNGTVVARYSYSPYGSLICEAGIAMNASCANGLPPTGMSLKHVCRSPGKTTHKRSPLASGAIPVPISPSAPCISRALNANPFYFAGQYLNKASSLYYLRARWYDPATAQFISVDPLVNVTHQPYQYAGDNPVSNTDPTGECECISPSIGVVVAKKFAGLDVESLLANIFEAFATSILASSVDTLLLGPESVFIAVDLANDIELLGELTTLDTLLATACGL